MQRTVAIVGRPNVGKSALFNRIARRQISLVFDRPGTTRDRVVADCISGGYHFTLIDTGGIGLEDKEGFAEAITREADLALAAATDIIFVVDAREGLTPLDREVAMRLRKAKKPVPVQVVANKADDDKQANFEGEFAALGFGMPLAVSAAHGRGIEDLIETLTEKWPDPEEASEEKPSEQRPTRIAIVGRPNVGKSSLINTVLQSERSIVSPTPGTTRDAVDVPFEHEGHRFILIDTAGMRQKRRLDDALESAMTSRSAHAINRADVCVLVIDAETGVSMQDKKIGGLIQEARRPCIIIVNKWDLARKAGDGGKDCERDYYKEVINDLFFVHYGPVLFMSAKTGERVQGLFRALALIEKTRVCQFQTGPLNRVLSRAMQRHAPPLVHGRRFKILYATQQTQTSARGKPLPTVLLFVNDTRLITPSYERYLDIQMREAFDLRGCPLQFVLRGREAKG